MKASSLLPSFGLAWPSSLFRNHLSNAIAILPLLVIRWMCLRVTGCHFNTLEPSDTCSETSFQAWRGGLIAASSAGLSGAGEWIHQKQQEGWLCLHPHTPKSRWYMFLCKVMSAQYGARTTIVSGFWQPGDLCCFLCGTINKAEANKKEPVISRRGPWDGMQRWARPYLAMPCLQ